jgi:SRSO17 transposase
MTTAMRGARHATPAIMSATPTWDGHGKRSDSSGYSGEQREENDAGLEGFVEKFAELSGALAPVFSRRDLRANALAYVRGLLMPGVAGNCWAIAEAVGHARPHRLQHLLSGAVWDEDAARDHVRGFVARHLGAAGVLIFDETGDLKKGTATAGAGRQYSGTAGRIENAIVAVYATYATAHGHALIDRDLYVQKEWFTDRQRMARAGFAPDHAFATKPVLARAQAERALDAGLTPAWGTGDEVYERSGELRELFEQRGIGYVFAIGADFRITTSGHEQMRADQARSLVEPHGGTGARPGPDRRGRATTTGRGSPPPHRAITCSSAVRSATRASSRTTSPTSPPATSAP